MKPWNDDPRAARRLADAIATDLTANLDTYDPPSCADVRRWVAEGRDHYRSRTEGRFGREWGAALRQARARWPRAWPSCGRGVR